MNFFKMQSEIAAPAAAVFTWHEEPGAFEKLTPPWQHVRIIDRSRPGIAIGTRITIEMRLGPFKQQWVAVHTAYEPGKMFRDEQVSGPFRHWVHTHKMEPRGPDRSLLTDEVAYELPFGLVGKIMGGWLMRRKLKRLFEYRHRVTREDCERIATVSGSNPASPKA